MTTRTVLVTGAAKRLGAAIARRLVADGHRVVVHYNGSADAAKALAAELDAPVVQGDLAELDGIDALFARARMAAGGPIDGLVNSASAFVFDRPPGVDAALMARLHAINAAAPALLASALARQDDVADGAVVDILDQKLANPNPDFFAYSCAKFALAGANTMLAQALGPRIAVNAVAPGLTLQSGDQSDAEFAEAASKNLLGRPIGAAAVAEAVSFLLTARGIAGQTLYVDCGQRFCRRDGDVMFEGRG
ncbi:NAD(P)-dependent dehydrogenase (short-subunit alcohol dehydrogenase family) [Sphingomonas sp. SORGH_AS870]|uniref:SDR family oxidoreductase n=1 Tax=Sphingomonas sp. SORGH_AS_0870 TaxID=3041801 RepID=UPI0028675735|nr:SDR family oxidoreductase [Sphingomonas sp. SORGH_AS_0870]MDR6147351.1 NAD(P)-dependent dehydrogenase (short-subunit alcohol dehydrogenase family) [Sphingomonas sp. SORGH_AS_0870]